MAAKKKPEVTEVREHVLRVPELPLEHVAANELRLGDWIPFSFYPVIQLKLVVYLEVETVLGDSGGLDKVARIIFEGNGTEKTHRGFYQVPLDATVTRMVRS